MKTPLPPGACADAARAFGVPVTSAQAEAMAASLAPALGKVAELRVKFEAEPSAYAANIAKGRAT